jgi:hypothetical protein
LVTSPLPASARIVSDHEGHYGPSAIAEMFVGAPGTPVPQVDPEDVRAVWKLGQEVKKDHPGGGVAIGMAIFERTCKPGAIVKAVVFRANMVGMLQYAAPDVFEP